MNRYTQFVAEFLIELPKIAMSGRTAVIPFVVPMFESSGGSKCIRDDYERWHRAWGSLDLSTFHDELMLIGAGITPAQLNHLRSSPYREYTAFLRLVRDFRLDAGLTTANPPKGSIPIWIGDSAIAELVNRFRESGWGRNQ
jgi:hypothetical protein